MHLSNVVKSHHASKRVFDFVPKKFDLGTPTQATDYLEIKKAGADFRMSDVIRIQTGVKEIENSDFEEMVELKTIEKLKDVQESAYQEAYQLGLEEGKAEALKNASAEIDSRLGQLDELLTSIRRLKTDLFQFNESHIVQLAFHMAARLAHAEVIADPDRIKDVIRQALEMAQLDEEVTVQVAPSQFLFLESLKKETGREYEFLKKVKLDASPEVTEGGCIIETNYGSIDARLEERVKKLWESIAESLYRVKDKISAA
jgi:flagellar assembly protein FliH